MNTSRVLADENIENGLMALLLRNPPLISEVAPILAIEDWYKPTYGVWYGVMLDLLDTGSSILRDPIVLPAHLAEVTGTATDHVDTDWARLLAGTSAHDAAAAADYLADLGERRRLQARVIETLQQVDGTAPTELIASELIDAVARLGRAKDRSVLFRGAELLADSDDDHEWVIPGFIGKGDRLVCVAPSGVGKSTLLRYMGMSSLVGRNPLNWAETGRTPRVLFVDQENPARLVRTGFRRMANYCASVDPTAMDRLAVRSYRQQLDLRGRTDRAMLEGWIEDHQPDIVLMGPAYKCIVGARQGENEQNSMTALTGIFDELIARYGFSLVLEHHGGKSDRSAPIGSSVWEWWPEFGRGLDPIDRHGFPVEDPRNTAALKVRAWRGDRIDVAWPESFARSPHSVWPFEPYWPDGIPRPRPADNVEVEPF